MSHSLSIDFILNERLSINKVLEILKQDWSFNDSGKINYLPLGDKEYNWTYSALSNEIIVIKELIEKQKKCEDVGIHIIHRKRNLGGALVYFYDSNTLSLSCTINRLKLKGDPFGRFSDINFYTSELLEVLYKCGAQIGGIETYDIY